MSFIITRHHLEVQANDPFKILQEVFVQEKTYATRRKFTLCVATICCPWIFIACIYDVCCTQPEKKIIHTRLNIIEQKIARAMLSNTQIAALNLVAKIKIIYIQIVIVKQIADDFEFMQDYQSPCLINYGNVSIKLREAMSNLLESHPDLKALQLEQCNTLGETYARNVIQNDFL